jgi:hypothetical protein
LLARSAAPSRCGDNGQDAGREEEKAVGARRGAQGQGRMDSQAARGLSPPSPTSEGRHAISMLEPVCRVRVAAACTREHV